MKFLICVLILVYSSGVFNFTSSFNPYWQLLINFQENGFELWQILKILVGTLAASSGYGEGFILWTTPVQISSKSVEPFAREDETNKQNV